MTNVILCVGKLKVCPLNSPARHRCPLSALLFNLVLAGSLSQALSQEMQIKGLQIEKERAKASLFADDDSIHKRPCRLHQQTLRAGDEQFQRSGREQN